MKGSVFCTCPVVCPVPLAELPDAVSLFQMVYFIGMVLFYPNGLFFANGFISPVGG